MAYRRYAVDASVTREAFPIRTLDPAETAAGLAEFHVGMDRPNEARALIAEARKADPASAASYVAEGLLLDREGKASEALVAFSKAAEHETTSAYALYRLATLSLHAGQPPRDMLVALEGHLASAVRLDVTFAGAYAVLGEIRSMLGQDES